MSGINSVAFNGYSNSAGYARRQQEPQQGPVAFRANDYPYYNEEPKKSKAGWVIGGTLVAAALAVAGMGYAYKVDALSKLGDGRVKDLLTKCEPAMKKCHEWCAWTKGQYQKCVDTVKGWFSKKD